MLGVVLAEWPATIPVLPVLPGSRRDLIGTVSDADARVAGAGGRGLTGPPAPYCGQSGEDNDCSDAGWWRG